MRTFAAAKGARVHHEYKILPDVINMRNLSDEAIEALSKHPDVIRVEEDRRVYAHLTVSTPLIQALQSQITGAGLSADGAGVRVCVLDTGIDSDHLMYSDRIDTAAGWDFVNNDSNPEDDNGHGTNVAGIVLGGTGLSMTRCGVSTAIQGVAPEATLIGVKILDSGGGGSFSDVIAGIDYCADQSPSGARADVMNLSLGGGQFSGNCDTDTAAQAANNAVDAGVVVVSSSGNDGYSNAMGTPACGSKVIAVGATYDDDYPNCEWPSQSSFTWCLDMFCFSTCTDNAPPQDSLICFSNQSDTIDVAAPGCIITSADNAPGGSTVSGMCGTSQASPHVAGLAALLLSADPSLTPAEVRQVIRDGAIDMGPTGFDRGYGYGRIDAINSLQLVGPGCTTPADCDDGLWCNGAEDCVSGSCVPGTPPDCHDGVACTDDSCNEGMDSCDNIVNDANCDNGLYCDGVETCHATLDCQSGTAPNCNDGVACTDDSCNEATDSCDSVANDANCDNGVYCDGAETCHPTLDCQVGTAVDCNDGVACTDDSCNEGTNSCDNVANDANCDNGVYCDGAETCHPTLDCQAGIAVDCSDGVSCTDDSCNEDTDLCDNVPNNALCDNGLFCDGAETCDALLDCQAGSDPCPGQLCDEVNDICTDCVTNEDCDDGLYCNGAETCDAGTCLPGATPDCSDAVACTVDSCNETTDSCDNIPDDNACDNGLFCDGAETCDSVLDCQAGVDPCPGQDCDEANDVCVPIGCDNDGICESGEDCNTCPNDCISGGGGGGCGNGVCEPSLGEDCLSCASDCRGKQVGTPKRQFCCGDGDGAYPVGCDDPRCTEEGWMCSDTPPGPYCCGDGTCEGAEDHITCEIDCPAPYCGDGNCDPGEDQCNCPGDCGAPPATETNCTDGVDNDCDGFTDSEDSDCACGATGTPCTSNADCCTSCDKKTGTCR